MLDVSEIDITSQNNRWIKLARSLHRRNQRYRERAILVEGPRPVSEAMDAGARFMALLIDSSVSSDSSIETLIETAKSFSVPVFRVAPDVFKSAADTLTPQGAIGLVSMPEPARFDTAHAISLALIVDQVRDPGNLGTMFRSALGVRVDAVFLTPGTVDHWSPKVIRAGAGSHFRLAIAPLDWENMPSGLQRVTMFGAEASGETDYDDVDWRRPAALVIGNETKGLSDEAKAHVHGRVGIPLASTLESLNAGVAASVILFEAARQRRKGMTP